MVQPDDPGRPDEFGLIARYFAPLAEGAPGAFGLKDDAAVVAVPPGRHLVVTTDMLVAGVHFLDDDPADSVGVKVLAVNLSDLAAMGAEPLGYVLAVALPAPWHDDQRLGGWLSGFVAGLAGMQNAHGVSILGGDTVSTSGPLCLSVTAFGSVVPGHELRRGGARPGDTVFVSGTIGDGLLGLRTLQAVPAARWGGLDPTQSAAVIERYRRPVPRLALGQGLVGVAHACADVSDGLIADLAHICRASGVTATIDAARVPLSPAGRTVVAADPALLPALLGGGDDYELVFTAAPEDAPAVYERARRGARPGFGDRHRRRRRLRPGRPRSSGTRHRPGRAADGARAKRLAPLLTVASAVRSPLFTTRLGRSRFAAWLRPDCASGMVGRLITRQRDVPGLGGTG